MKLTTNLIICILIPITYQSCTYEQARTCNDDCTPRFADYIDGVASESVNWDSADSEQYLKSFGNTDLGKCISNIDILISCRPDPTCYLPEKVINYHLDLFRESGASFIMSNYDLHINDFSSIGRAPNLYDTNGVQWVTPDSVQTRLLTFCSQTPDPQNCLLEKLYHTPEGSRIFQRPYTYGINAVMQIQVNRLVLQHSGDILHLRMPSGNEAGAFDSWIPGGYNLGGIAEALIDSTSMYCWVPVSTVDSASKPENYCYPNCKPQCGYSDQQSQACIKSACGYRIDYSCMDKCAAADDGVFECATPLEEYPRAKVYSCEGNNCHYSEDYKSPPGFCNYFWYANYFPNVQLSETAGGVSKIAHSAGGVSKIAHSESELGLMLKDKTSYCDEMEEIITKLMKYDSNTIATYSLEIDTIKHELQEMIDNLGVKLNSIIELIENF